jgi:hypothetical protein
VSYELHALLRAYLQHRAGEAWNAEQRRDVLVRAAQVLESEGASADAVEIYRELGDWASLARSVVASAQALLGQGRHRTLLDWIQMLPEEIREAVPRVRYWKGSALATIAPREARAELGKGVRGLPRPGRPPGPRARRRRHRLYLLPRHVAPPGHGSVGRGAERRADAGTKYPTPAIELHVKAAELFALGSAIPTRHASRPARGACSC